MQKLNIGTVIITAALVAFYAVVGQSNRFSAPFSAEISFTEILTAGNNTLLADSPEFSFSNNCSACVGQDSTQAGPSSRCYRDRISQFVVGYPPATTEW